MHINRLPPELFVHIIDRCNVDDILRLGCVSKNFYHITNDEKVWKKIVRRECALIAFIDDIEYKKFYFRYVNELDELKKRMICKVCSTTNNISKDIYNMRWWIVPQKISQLRCSRCNTIYVYKRKYNITAFLVLFLYTASPSVIPYLLTYVYDFYGVGFIYQLILAMIYSMFLFKFLIYGTGHVQRFMLF